MTFDESGNYLPPVIIAYKKTVFNIFFNILRAKAFTNFIKLEPDICENIVFNDIDNLRNL